MTKPDNVDDIKIKTFTNKSIVRNDIKILTSLNTSSHNLVKKHKDNDYQSFFEIEANYRFMLKKIKKMMKEDTYPNKNVEDKFKDLIDELILTFR